MQLIIISNHYPIFVQGTFDLTQMLIKLNVYYEKKVVNILLIIFNFLHTSLNLNSYYSISLKSDDGTYKFQNIILIVI